MFQLGFSRLPEAFSRFRLAGLCAILALAATAAVAEPGLATRVQISLRVEGELFAPAGDESQPVREPIDLDAAFDFLETAGAAAVSRHYREAAASVTVAGRRERTALAADAREVLVALAGTTPTPRLADGFLSRQEAELLDIPFDPLLLDRLVPSSEQAEAGSWQLPGDVVAGLLAIDTVQSGGIEVRLDAATAAGRALQFSGTVLGAVDGAATRIELAGTARLADAAGTDGGRRIDLVEVTITERREAGWVAPGLDVKATVRISRTDVTAEAAETVRADRPAGSADALAAPAAGRPRGAGRPGTVWHRHPHGRYTLVLDRRWRVVEDGPEGLVMRLADRGALVAQCSILPLPRSAPEAAPNAPQVSRDVERSLGGQFGRVIEAEETTRDDGTRVVRVVADGSAEGRPFRWIHHVLADPLGHRAALTCMLEPALADRFGAADHELAAGIVLLPDPPAGRPAAPATNPADRQAALPEKPGSAGASP